MYTVYMIKCEADVYYVGVSAYLLERIDKHFAGKGASVTRRFKPLGWKTLKEFDTEREAKRYEGQVVNGLRKQGTKAYGAAHTGG